MNRSFADAARAAFQFVESIGLPVMLVIALAACSPRGNSFATLTSPTGAYAVQLNGSAAKPHVPFVYAKVWATAKGKGRLCDAFELYLADWFDRAFFVRYFQPTWVSENAIAFRAQGDGLVPQVDTLVIRNQSASVVPCLKVNLVDLLFVMDLRPDQELKLPVSLEPGSVYFAAELQRPGGGLFTAKDSFDRSAYERKTLYGAHNQRGRYNEPRGRSSPKRQR
jgi:hypothetical protein